jgi:hypothetical protein
MKNLATALLFLVLGTGISFGQKIKSTEIDTTLSGIISDFRNKPAYVLTNQDTSDFSEIDSSSNGWTKRTLKWKYYDESIVITVKYKSPKTFDSVKVIQKVGDQILQYIYERKNSEINLTKFSILPNGSYGEKTENKIALIAFQGALQRLHGKLKSITVGKKPKPTKAP